VLRRPIETTALIGKVGFSTNLTGNPTNQDFEGTDARKAANQGAMMKWEMSRRFVMAVTAARFRTS
jgi:hypothetical protein